MRMKPSNQKLAIAVALLASLSLAGCGVGKVSISNSCLGPCTVPPTAEFDKGKPKALVQVAASCKVIAVGRIPTVMKPGRIYPVCVSDEPAVESFFFTTYANELFQKEVAPGFGIQPVTMMSPTLTSDLPVHCCAGRPICKSS